MMATRAAEDGTIHIAGSLMSPEVSTLCGLPSIDDETRPYESFTTSEVDCPACLDCVEIAKRFILDARSEKRSEKRNVKLCLDTLKGGAKAHE